VSKCGFNCNTKKEILYGPSELGGAGFRNLYTEQGVGMVQQIMSHLRTEGQAGTMAQIGFAWAQYSSGMEYSIFDLPHTVLPHLDSIYLKAFCRFLTDINGSIRTNQDGVIPLPRRHDKFLMQTFVDSNQYTADELIRIDLCQKYIQTLTLSDICTPEGDYFDEAKINRYPTSSSCYTTMHCFNQARPPKRDWNLWKRAIPTHF